MADLESERLIVMKEGHCLGDQVLGFCNRRDFHPNVLCRSAQIETIQALVRAGMGISLIPAMACASGPGDQPRYRSLAPPSPRRAVAALWLKDRPPGRAATVFLKHLPKPRAGGVTASGSRGESLGLRRPSALTGLGRDRSVASTLNLRAPWDPEPWRDELRESPSRRIRASCNSALRRRRSMGSPCVLAGST